MDIISKEIDLTRIYDLADELANLYRQYLINADAVASRQLVNFKDDVVLSDGVLKVDFELPQYWKEIEFGRGKTIEPMGNIVYPKIKEWINVKRIVPKPDKNGVVPTLEQLAYLITRKIHRVGYKARKPLTNTLNDPRAKVIIKQLCDEIGNAMSREVNYSLLSLTELDDNK